MAPRRSRKLVLITAIAASVLAVIPSAGAMTSSGEAATSHSLLDAARRNAGRPALASDARVQRIAQAQAERMAAQGRIFHNDHLGQDASAQGVDWRWLGENVGVGPSAQVIHDGFMHSPPHRANILYPDANLVGVGGVVGKDGRVYIAQVFAKEIRSASTPHRVVVAPVRPVVQRRAARRAPIVFRPSPDPNVVIGGVVTEGTFEPPAKPASDLSDRAVRRAGPRPTV